MASVASLANTDDELSEFLESLRQRYNLGDAPLGSPTGEDAQELHLVGAAGGNSPSNLRAMLSGQAAGAAAAAAHPAAPSEAASCPTPQLLGLAASQLTQADGATPLALGGAGVPAAGARAAGGFGAVAAAATPHSTAAMPAQRLMQQHQHQQLSELGSPQGGAGARLQQQVAQRPSPVHPAMAAALGPCADSAASSPSSVAKPLLGAFTAAAAAEPVGQPQLQDLESPRRQADSNRHAPLAAGSPPRPLLGVWAAHAAAASVGSTSPGAPYQHPAAGEALVATAAAASDAASQPDSPAAASSAAAISPSRHVPAAAEAALGSSSSSAAAAPSTSMPAPPSASAAAVSASASPAAGLPDWHALSSQLSRAGFGPLVLEAASSGAAAAEEAPQLAGLHATISRVLREFDRREGLVAQLLAEQEERRRSGSRGVAELDRLERERDEAVRAAAKAKAELADVRGVTLPGLEAKHREAAAKAASEVARLKHALKEAEGAAAAAAKASAAAASSRPALATQLQDALREREKLRLEVERLESELARQKPYIRELEKAADAARTAARASDEQAALLERELRQARAAHVDEAAALHAELAKARHAAREAEAAAFAARSAQAAGEAGQQAAPELQRALAAQQAAHEEQAAHMTSELQRLRQQLLQLQQAATRAEASAKADSSAAAYSSKQLVQVEKQQKAETAKLSAELRAAREAGQQLQARVVEAEGAAAEAAAAASRAEADALQESDRAAGLAAELDRQRSAARQQQQHLAEQLADAKRALQDSQQQLASTQEELRRLRAATGLAEAAAASAASGGAGVVVGEAAAVVAAAAATAAESAAAAGGAEGSDARKSAWGVGVGGRDGGAPAATAGPVPAAAAAAAASGAAAAGSAGGATDLAAALARAVAAEAAAAQAEAQAASLRYKLTQQEMACCRRELDAEALRDQLAHRVVREERRLARDKEVYARIKQAFAASRRGLAPPGSSHHSSHTSAPGGVAWDAAAAAGALAARRGGGSSNAAGALAATTRELRPVELVALYEGQKEAQEAELAAAKAEVRVLSGQLRDAQNLLIARDRAAAVAAAAAGIPGGAVAAASLGDPAAMVATQKRSAELQRELSSVRSEAAAALRDAGKRLAESEASAERLQGDVQALQAELDARPTVAEQRQLRREIDILQRKIASLRRAAGSGAAGAEGLSAAAEEAAVAAKAGTGRSVQAAVARDRALARLGLHVAEEYPRDVLVDLVQDMCIVLELRDATLLVPSIKKVATVAGAIPSVEAFVAQVCELVFRDGLAFMPPPGTLPAGAAGFAPSAVPRVLQHWLSQLRRGALLAQCADQLQQLLARRGVPAAAGGVQETCQQLLAQVRSLLQVEAEAIAAADVIDTARGLLASQPQQLLERILLQAMQVLGVDAVEGLPAAVNRLYVHHTELQNVFRAAASLLALPRDAGPSAVQAAIGKLVQEAAKPPSAVRAAAAQLLQEADAAAAASDQREQQRWQQAQHELAV